CVCVCVCVCACAWLSAAVVNLSTLTAIFRMHWFCTHRVAEHKFMCEKPLCSRVAVCVCVCVCVCLCTCICVGGRKRECFCEYVCMCLCVFCLRKQRSRKR